MNHSLEHLVSLLFTTSRLFRERIAEGGKFGHFSFLKFEVLNYISQKKNPSMRDIAGFLHTSPPSATSLIEGLIQAGELTRTSDKNDRRIVRLALTAKGLKTIEEGMRRKKECMKEILGVLDEKERRALIEIFEKISKTNNQQ